MAQAIFAKASTGMRMMAQKKFAMRVIKGGFVPADNWVKQELAARKYHIDDIVFCTFTKPRNPQFNRLVHAFGELIHQNIQGFEYLDAHMTLKRLQAESGIGCDQIAVTKPGKKREILNIPQSLAFESMDEGTFSKFYKEIAEYVAATYWQGLSAEQIQEMAEMMED